MDGLTLYQQGFRSITIDETDKGGIDINIKVLHSDTEVGITLNHDQVCELQARLTTIKEKHEK